MRNVERKQAAKAAARPASKPGPKPGSFKQRRREEAQRRRRMWILGGAVLGAVVLAVILIIATQPPKPVGAFETVPTRQWAQAEGSAMGPADAKVVVTEWADFQCPICRTFQTQVFEQIYKDYVATGKVRYEFHHYLVIDKNTGGRESRQAALAAECAGEQNRFWDYANMLYTNQAGEASGAFSNERLKAFAQAIGLDTGQFNSCFDSGKYNAKVSQQDAQAPTLGLTGTPSLLVNGVKVSNALDYNAVKAAIDAASK